MMPPTRLYALLREAKVEAFDPHYDKRGTIDSQPFTEVQDMLLTDQQNKVIGGTLVDSRYFELVRNDYAQFRDLPRGTENNYLRLYPCQGHTMEGRGMQCIYGLPAQGATVYSYEGLAPNGELPILTPETFVVMLNATTLFQCKNVIPTNQLDHYIIKIAKELPSQAYGDVSARLQEFHDKNGEAEKNFQRQLNILTDKKKEKINQAQAELQSGLMRLIS